MNLGQIQLLYILFIFLLCSSSTLRTPPITNFFQGLYRGYLFMHFHLCFGFIFFFFIHGASQRNPLGFIALLFFLPRSQSQTVRRSERNLHTSGRSVNACDSANGWTSGSIHHPQPNHPNQPPNLSCNPPWVKFMQIMLKLSTHNNSNDCAIPIMHYSFLSALTRMICAYGRNINTFMRPAGYLCVHMSVGVRTRSHWRVRPTHSADQSILSLWQKCHSI